MTVAPAPTLLAARIDAVLAGFVDGQRLLWPDDDLRPMLDTVRRFILTGGKRLRPAFCYWAWRGVAAPEERGEDQAAVTAGAALELFHCFALIHDDIIDAGSRRRGQASMHEEFAAAHARHGWRGDARSFGRNTALLCGDLCAMWAEELLTGCPTAPVRLAQAQRLFAVMRAEAVAGEYLEVVAQAMGDFGDGARQRAARVVQLKTARYSVVRPLQIGAVLAGASDAVLDGLAAFGEPLGEAFQLRDDVLGVFGDPARTGKSVLDDLRQAKPTTLLAEAFARGMCDRVRCCRRTWGIRRWTRRARPGCGRCWPSRGRWRRWRSGSRRPVPRRCGRWSSWMWRRSRGRRWGRWPTSWRADRCEPTGSLTFPLRTPISS
ncbi:polyprenyl synthetase family protein [Catellatospora coxensis]